MTKRTCSEDNCPEPVKGRGLCMKHYARWRRARRPATPKRPVRLCSIEGCGKKSYIRGWCSMHHSRWKRTGDPLLKTTPKPALPPCLDDGCDEPGVTLGRCRQHHQRWYRRNRANAPACSVEGCERPAQARGWCTLHYGRWHRLGDVQADRPLRPRQSDLPPGTPCSVDGCDGPHFARDWCKRHYVRWQKTGDVRADVPIAAVVIINVGQCAVDDCESDAFHKGWCMVHYSRWRRTGTTDPPPAVTEDVLARRRDARRVYDRKYKADEYKRRADEIKANQRAWKVRNRDRVRLSDARKRAKRRMAPVVPFTPDQLAAKVAYWGHKCWLCGAPYQAIDHVKPVMAGGWHVLANLRPACNRCNSSKGHKWPFDTARRSLAA